MRVASLLIAILLLLPLGASAASTISQGGTATTSFSYGLIGSIGGLNYLRNFATSTLYGTGTGGQVLSWLNGIPTWIATSSIQNLSFTYPLQNLANVVSLLFGTTTSNTWGGTQSFTNPLVDGTLTGLIAGNSGTTYATATSTLNTNGGIILSGSGFLVGGTGITLTAKISTSTVPTISGLAYWTGNGTPSLLSSIATSTLTASSPLTGSFTQIGSGGSLGCQTASGSQAGCLSSADWTTFNNKQAAGNYITALTGDVTASGPGSVAATIAANAVTYAKFQQVAANSLVGNPTGATANAQAIATSSLNLLPQTLLLPKGNFLVGNDAGVAQATSTIFISSTGQIGIGTTTPGTILTIDATVSATNPTLVAQTALGWQVDEYANGTGSGGQNAFRRAGGTYASPSATLLNMTLGSLSFRGMTDALAFTGSKVFIQGAAAENWTTTANGTFLRFSTTPLLGTTLTTAMTIDSTQGVSIGATYAATVNAAPANGLRVQGNTALGLTTPINRLDVAGGVAIGSYAGANTAPSNGLIVSDNVGIGTTTPSQKLNVNGNIFVEGAANGIIVHDTITSSCYIIQVVSGVVTATSHACL